MLLQEFAWTEEEKDAKLQQRRRQYGQDCEPMFCFETAIKNYYLSHLIYSYQKVRDLG